MASTTFLDNQTVIYAAWLNDVNNAVYNGIFVSPSITATSVICSGTASGVGFTNLINNTFTAPGPIGSVTPNTGAFTTLTATTPIGAASGGTGRSTLTANNVLLGNGTSAVQQVAPGTAGNILTSNGTTWVSGSAGLGNASQTYQDVTASRTNGTTYTNSTSAPIQVSIKGGDNTGQSLTLTILVNGNATPVTAIGAPANTLQIWTVIVPPGQTYSASWNASGNFNSWWEFR
jgi:hypothetical protein